mgnify:CR=1 FL=1|jgi:glutathione S-transferase
MLLIGRDLSPFVRRTATVIEVLGLPYKRCKLATADEPEKVLEFNPLARVPALRLDDGEVLFDSSAIIDYLLECGDDANTLLPASGRARRDVLRNSAIATGVMEKGVAAAYEMRRRPAAFVYEPWLQYIKQQISDGLAYLESASDGGTWLSGPEMRLDDINAVVAYDYIHLIHSDLVSADSTGLAALSARANALPTFRNTQWKNE